MMEFFDSLETRDPAQREEEQFAALRAQIANAQQQAPYFARVLAGVNAADIRTAPRWRNCRLRANPI